LVFIWADYHDILRQDLFVVGGSKRVRLTRL
jgi:hypothetical protein